MIHSLQKCTKLLYWQSLPNFTVAWVAMVETYAKLHGSSGGVLTKAAEFISCHNIKPIFYFPFLYPPYAQNCTKHELRDDSRA
jgi:hypothetical protein